MRDRWDKGKKDLSLGSGRPFNLWFLWLSCIAIRLFSMEGRGGAVAVTDSRWRTTNKNESQLMITS